MHYFRILTLISTVIVTVMNATSTKVTPPIFFEGGRVQLSPKAFEKS